MRIFISYSRKDRPIADIVREDLTRARGSVWLDRELTGGQAWWNTILENIRSCDLFVFLLSPESLRSKACQSELRYAIQSGRPLLPVMVSPVSVQLAPREIADSQIVDYTERTADSVLALITAVSTQPPAPPVPDPLPTAPPPPLSYMNPYREQIQADALSYRDQSQLVLALRDHLQVEDEQDTARGLLVELRRRRDIVESVGRDIDQLLRTAPEPERVPSTGPRSDAADYAAEQNPIRQASPAGPTPPPWVGQAGPDSGGAGPAPGQDPSRQASPGQPTPAPWMGGVGSAAPAVPTRTGSDPTQSTSPLSPAGQVAAGWHPDPTRRYEYRYWDGARWTDHVSRGGVRGVDAIDGTSAAPAGSGTPPLGAQAPVAAFTGGALAGLIVATVFVGPVGIIVGALNLKYKPRRGQAQILLWLGVAICVFWILSWFSALSDPSYY